MSAGPFSSVFPVLLFRLSPTTLRPSGPHTAGDLRPFRFPCLRGVSGIFFSHCGTEIGHFDPSLKTGSLVVLLFTHDKAPDQTPVSNDVGTPRGPSYVREGRDGVTGAFAESVLEP